MTGFVEINRCASKTLHLCTVAPLLGHVRCVCLHCPSGSPPTYTATTLDSYPFLYPFPIPSNPHKHRLHIRIWNQKSSWSSNLAQKSASYLILPLAVTRPYHNPLCGSQNPPRNCEIKPQTFAFPSVELYKPLLAFAPPPTISACTNTSLAPSPEKILLQLSFFHIVFFLEARKVSRKVSFPKCGGVGGRRGEGGKGESCIGMAWLPC